MPKSKNTKPELLVQEQLCKWNVHFECHAKDLPGTPDLVIRKEKIAVLIHGCFWHQHGACSMSRDLEKMDSNWKLKFVKSSRYDLAIISKLKELEWEVLILWECEIYANLQIESEKIIRSIYLKERLELSSIA